MENEIKKQCLICGQDMMLVGGGWVCTNVECLSCAHIVPSEEI